MERPNLTDLYKRQPAPPGPMVRLVQKDKKFTPHVLAITVGTEIEFPNQDPYFHDVFSIYHGKPFDLGLYESGTTKNSNSLSQESLIFSATWLKSQPETIPFPLPPFIAVNTATPHLNKYDEPYTPEKSSKY